MSGAWSPESRLTQAPPPWALQVERVLDDRLQRDVDHPLVVALSGGSDSVALLHLAAGWSRRRGRRVLALTVDHGLSPESDRWNESACAVAMSLGVEWRRLDWSGPKPETGLPAAAREARQRLLAEQARKVQARVILMAHTADDVAETEFMRAGGTSLGRMREWGPSPSWPEGRGLAVLRPLLGARKADLRSWLATRGAGWIEDPANHDVRFARARARRALAGQPCPEPSSLIAGPTFGLESVEDDVVHLVRTASARTLAASLVCAGGGDRPPRGERLRSLLSRLASGERFVAALAGARVEAHRDVVSIMREPGEIGRRAGVLEPLAAGREFVWDGRWLLTPSGSGWVAACAKGHLSQLTRGARDSLRRLPAAARAARPVLIRNSGDTVVLAEEVGESRPLIGPRLEMALDRMTHESHLGVVFHGALDRKHLFSGNNITNEGARLRPEEPRRE